MPIEQIRSLLVIALVGVLFLMWQAWQADYGQREAQPSSGAASGAAPAAGAAGGAARPDVPEVPEEAAGAAAGGAQPSAPAAPAAGAATVQVRTDLLEAGISPRGGNLVHLALRAYPVEPGHPEQPTVLFHETPPGIFLAQSGLLGGEAAPTHHSEYQVEGPPRRQLAPGQDSVEVRLHWSSPDGVRVTKIFTFHRDSYVIDVTHRVENGSDQPWSGRMYGQFQRSKPESKRGLFRIYTYTGGVISTSEKPYEKIDFDDISSEPLDRSSPGGWAAMIQHYFVGAWVPPADGDNHYYSKAVQGPLYVLGVISRPQEIAPGQSGSLSMRMYTGPKLQERMEKVAPYLERTLDFGWLWFIAEPIFWLLKKIHSLLGNWGWSIVVLTILIKGAFFKLSAASYKSMARMRKLQPRLTALRERYGDDKQRMNQAMMQMYKEEKINPLGGCLPIAVQIPFFISLYWVLLGSVELRQADFMLWIHDLSNHDPYFVLPILMGISMFAQQKLNPSPPDPTQAKIMMALPFVFTFFFLFFPAGLVLYWLVNNILSIAQQWVITRRIIPKME